MTSSQIVTWVCRNFNLGDLRRSRALGVMVAGLITSGKVGFAAIGRAMVGAATEASMIVRVFSFCHNDRVDPAVVQAALIRLLVAKTSTWWEDGRQLVAVSIDWHYYDHGEVCGLRVSLLTGSRAIPLLWYEIKQADLKGRQKEIEYRALEELISLRPLGITWVVLLDSGFRSSARMRKLAEVGYFILRSDSATKVHLPGSCWRKIGELGVQAGHVVEFGYIRWSRLDPEPVRLVACKLLKLVQTVRKARRTSGATSRSSVTIPGLWPLLTNLPMEHFSALAVVRMYARRFECEHNFRDTKNATLGLDMEHVHLVSEKTYERLMCIVAVAESLLWVIGAEAESRGMAQELTPSRPKDGHRVLSLFRVGQLCIHKIRCSISPLFKKHLGPAIRRVPQVVGRGWVDAVEPRIVEGHAPTANQLPPLPSVCGKKRLEAPPKCVDNQPVLLHPKTNIEHLYQLAA